MSTSSIFELTDLPAELLCDPSTWLPAKKVENFLSVIEEKFHALTPNAVLIEMIGHDAKELRGWGVLDSVLRMMENPQEIYLQPHRFISYFVSPSPPIANLTRADSSVSFDLPIAWEEYPQVNCYLKASLESLPVFIGNNMAEVKWAQNSISITWCLKQATFEVGELKERKMAPEFVESLIETLEKTEQALVDRTRELDRIRQENQLAAKSNTTDLEKWFHLYRNFNRYTQQVMKLQDYFTRSKQLVTLLVAQDRMSPQVKEAMKRVGWESIQSQFPEIATSLLNDFEGEKQLLNTENLHAKNSEGPRPRNSGQSWFANS
ncbi:MAG: hypothetical protein AABZ31_02840 [Bdellovibrionota bacterium]